MLLGALHESRLHLFDGKSRQRDDVCRKHEHLVARAYQHRNGLVDGFTREHGCTLLVWFEAHDDLQEARRRESQIKKWKRDWKLKLIESENPDWLDLYPGLL